MKNIYKILIIVAVVIAAGVGYYTYTEYNALKTQEIMKSSQGFKDNATSYYDQAADYENNGDYSHAITTYQKSDDEFKRALASDNSALNYAGGVYREYLNKDVQLIEQTSKLIEYKIYLNQYHNNSLNPGQEKVSPSMLKPYIDKFEGEVAALKVEENQIIQNNPDTFKFLNL